MKHYKNINYGFMNTVYFSKRRKNKNIIIHNTAISGDKEKAETIAKNFSLKISYASADYVVDSTNVFCLLDKTKSSWCTGGNLYNDIAATGGGKYYRKVLDIDSINIEVCNIFDSINRAALENLIYLVRDLKAIHKISNKNIYRHFDITGKYCPKLFSKTPYGDYTSNWLLLKKCFKTLPTTEIDIRKDGSVWKLKHNSKKWVKIGVFKLQ